MKENNYKGFTLIELLAVIVILAIIALIATPIVLDIIDDTKKSSMLRSADFYLDGVEFSIANSVLDGISIKDGTYYITDKGNICLEEYDTEEKVCKDTDTILDNNELIVKVNGEVPTSGTITIRSGNIADIEIVLSGKTIKKNEKGELVFDEEKAAEDEKEEQEEEKVCTVEKGDGTKPGDEIECAGEYFYVISNDGSKINMLAMYNLDVGKYGKSLIAIPNPTGIQNEKARGYVVDAEYNWDGANTYGIINFSSTNYWYDSTNSVLKEAYGTEYPAWVYTDKEGNLDETNVVYTHVENYEKYLKENGVKSAEGTLISYEQLISLGCDSSTGACASEVKGVAKGGKAPEWVYSTSYWSGSASSVRGVWNVGSYGSFGSNNYMLGGNFGVRPVIIISTSEI